MIAAHSKKNLIGISKADESFWIAVRVMLRFPRSI